jgi:hypothetical protein
MHSNSALQQFIPQTRFVQTIALWFGFISISLTFYVIQNNSLANFQNFKLQYAIASFFFICASFLSFLLLLANGIFKKSYLIIVIASILFFITNFLAVKAIVELVQNGNVLIALYNLIFAVSGLLVSQLLTRLKQPMALFSFTLAWCILTLLFYEQFFLNAGNSLRNNVLQFITNPQAQSMFSNVLLFLSVIGFATLCNVFVVSYFSSEKKTS